MTIIRVLQMIGSLRMGGSQAMIVNLYKNIDRNQIQFDFILDHNEKIDLKLVPIVKKLGAKIYYLPTFKGWNIIEIIKSWHNFFKHHSEYKLIHSHVRSYAFVFLCIAKLHGLKTIIHSHSTTEGRNLKSLIKRLLEFPLRYVADYYFACSNESGKWLFGNKIVKQHNYRIIPNAIDLERFKFNPIIRKEYREKLGVQEDTKVFVHVGRFHPSKNHKFLLNLFSEINKQFSNSILILIGDGALRDQIENQIEELELKEYVKLLGIQINVDCWLQAADCMLFPSLWEGLPVTIVEAQASGLKCFVSNNITKEVNVSPLINYLPIDEESKSLWLEKIMDWNFKRENVTQNIRQDGFDIRDTVKILSSYYKENY